MDRFLAQEIESALATLPPRDAKVLRLYFGLDGGREHTLEEIGGMLGVTRERIRQLRDRALKRLREGEVGQGAGELRGLATGAVARRGSRGHRRSLLYTCAAEPVTFFTSAATRGHLALRARRLGRRVVGLVAGFGRVGRFWPTGPRPAATSAPGAAA